MGVTSGTEQKQILARIHTQDIWFNEFCDLLWPIASRASFWSPVPHIMCIASSQLPWFRADFTPFTAIHLSSWRAESETVLGLSWVAVVGMLWYDRLTLLYETFSGLLTEETKIYFTDTNSLVSTPSTNARGFAHSAAAATNAPSPPPATLSHDVLEAP